MDFKKMQERYEAFSKSAGGFFRPESGQNNIRLLPGWPDPAQPDGTSMVPWVEATDHFVGGEVNLSFYCLGMPGLEVSCPICRESRKLKGNTDENLKEIGMSIIPKKVFLWNLIVRGKEKEGVKVFKTGRRVQEQLLGYVMDMEHYPQILDIEQGIDMILDKKGQGKLVTYAVRLLHQRSPLLRTSAETQALYATAKDLTKEIHFESAEKLEKVMARFLGIDEADFLKPTVSAPATSVFPKVPPPQTIQDGATAMAETTVAQSFPSNMAVAPPVLHQMVAPVAVAPPTVVQPPATPIAAPVAASVLVPASGTTPAAEKTVTDLKALRERVAHRMGKA